MRSRLRRLLRGFGWDLCRLSSSTSPDATLVACLRAACIGTVFDIGANEGQFASRIRSAGYRGVIVSFEPLSRPRRRLLSLAAHDDNWLIHPRAALGKVNGRIDINVARNSVSSSVLPILETHTNAARDSAYIGVEQVPVERLDTVVEAYTNITSPLFVKIDAQGYESQVIEGGARTLEMATGVMCELSLVPLYSGQCLWEEMLQRFRDMGFIVWALQQGFTDARTGRSLQVDAVFLRPDAVESHV